LPFFYLPSLQRLAASIHNAVTSTWPAAQIPVPLNIRSLELSCVREASLGGLLSITPKLKTLRWNLYYDAWLRDDCNSPIIDLDQIADAMSHVRGTLTDLTILAEVDYGKFELNLPGLKTEGSLRVMVNFVMLKRLHISWAFLVGFAQNTTKRLQDVIPQNIEFLTITNDLCIQNCDQMEPQWPAWEWEDHAILSLLRSWLKEWKPCTPHLWGISMEWVDEGFDEWGPDMRQRLRDLGIHAGVQLEISIFESS
jgi:hypothetical protein